MIEALAVLFAGYAAYTGWPWWSAPIVGALCGFQVANARMYRGENKERIAAGDRAMAGKLFQSSLIGVVAGAAISCAIYFLVTMLLGSS